MIPGSECSNYSLSCRYFAQWYDCTGVGLAYSLIDIKFIMSGIAFKDQSDEQIDD